METGKVSRRHSNAGLSEVIGLENTEGEGLEIFFGIPSSLDKHIIWILWIKKSTAAFNSFISHTADRRVIWFTDIYFFLNGLLFGHDVPDPSNRYNFSLLGFWGRMNIFWRFKDKRYLITFTNLVTLSLGNFIVLALINIKVSQLLDYKKKMFILFSCGKCYVLILNQSASDIGKTV